MIKLTFLLAGLLLNLIAFGGNGEWELEKNASGIKIYTRTVDGEEIKEFKALTTINAPRKTIASILLNLGDYANWYPDISKAEIIKKIRPNEYYIYNIVDVPWPATDRDGVSKMTVSVTAAKTTIKFKAASGIKAKNNDCVRIKKSYGSWQLTPDGESTKVKFQYFASPGGSLPDWIINMFLIDNPYETLKQLKKKAEA